MLAPAQNMSRSALPLAPPASPYASALLPRAPRPSVQHPRAAALIMNALTLRPPTKSADGGALTLLTGPRGFAPGGYTPEPALDTSMRALPRMLAAEPAAAARGPQAAWVDAELLSIQASFDDLLGGLGTELCLPDMGAPLAPLGRN